MVAAVNYDDALGAQDEWLITPTLDLTGASSYVFTAEIGLSYYWSVSPFNNYDVFVKISTDGGTSWTQLWTESDLGVFTNWVMNPVTLDLTQFAGNANVKIAFQYVGADGAALYLDNVKVLVPPSSPPNCPTLISPATGSTGTPYTVVDFSWDAPSSGETVDSYDVYLDTNADPTTLVGNTTSTSFTIEDLLPTTTYYWKVVPKNLSGSATGCSVFSFTTEESPTSPYCGPLDFSFNVEPITLVNFAGINNVTDATIDGSPSHEIFLDQTAQVDAGSNYDITLKGNTGGNFTNRFVVFVDWNQDGDFADFSETYEVTQTLVNSTGTDSKEVVHSINVPETATGGLTRLRVKKIFGTTNYLNPCSGASFGQAEEYTVNVIALAAVSEASKVNAKLYPNPVKDVATLEASSKIKSVNVYDASGKLVLTYQMNAVKTQLDLSRLVPGIYLVKFDTEKGTQSLKIIKK